MRVGRAGRGGGKLREERGLRNSEGRVLTARDREQTSERRWHRDRRSKENGEKQKTVRDRPGPQQRKEPREAELAPALAGCTEVWDKGVGWQPAQTARATTHRRQGR